MEKVKGIGAYKYDTLTDTYTQLTNIPYEPWRCAVVSVGTDVYILGGSGIYAIYKYDTLTDTYTKMVNMSFNFYGGSATAVGTDIYMFGGYGARTTAYKYNTLTNSLTKLTNIPYEFSRGSAVSVGPSVYLLGTEDIYSNYNYKYDTLTNTYTKMTNIPYNFYAGSAEFINNNLYLLGGYNSKTTNRKYIVAGKSYETDNTVVIEELPTYSIELFNTDFEEGYKPKYNFSDVWFYTTNDGLIMDIPTYYGDGTQWVNIKNPPTEGGNN